MICSNCEKMRHQVARLEGECMAHKTLRDAAVEELGRLKATLNEMELALEEKMEIAKYNALLRNPDIKYPHRLSREGDDGRWYGYSQALGLLRQAREGKLEIGGASNVE